MVLSKPSVLERPTDLDNSRTRAFGACNRCRWEWLDICLSTICALFCLPLSGRRPDIDCNIVSKGR